MACSRGQNRELAQAVRIFLPRRVIRVRAIVNLLFGDENVTLATEQVSCGFPVSSTIAQCCGNQRRMRMDNVAAPELQTTDWLNTDEPVLLEALRGKVVLIEAFQMLCPGCVSHGLPQAMRVHRVFNRDDVAVIGLHTVFEHHGAQGTRVALEAFLHEYKIVFPVGIDAPSGNGGLPKTMARYGMRGTPTLILVDRQGRLRKHKFGLEDDLVLGAEIMSLVRDGGDTAPAEHAGGESPGCSDEGCSPPVK